MISHNCGVVVGPRLHDVYRALKPLQHRGKEVAGFAGISDDGIDVLRYIGFIDRFDEQGIESIFRGFRSLDKYHTWFGHVRYATRGREDRILDDGHPHVIGGERVERSGHLIIANAKAAIVHNGQVDEKLLTHVNRNDLLTDCDSEALLHELHAVGPAQVLKNVPLAYTIAAADIRLPEPIVVMRDRTGIKPGWWGEKDGKFAMASENIGLYAIDAHLHGEIKPGVVYHVDREGRHRKEIVVQETPRRCFFEYNYIASPDSVMDGVKVRDIRESLGRALANEIDYDAEVVTDIPRCPRPAAEAFAKERKIPFEETLYKPMHNRFFQGSNQEQRAKDAGSEVYPVNPALERIVNKKTVVVDDSIVRGTNSTLLMNKFFTDSREPVLASYTPPIGIIGADGKPRGCEYGVDMPPSDKFVAREGNRNRTLEEISGVIGCDVRYLSTEKMLQVFEEHGIKRNSLCTFCIGGKRPA